MAECASIPIWAYKTCMEDQIKSLRIVSFSRLSKKRFAEVRRFVARCAQKDAHDPLFYWESIKNRKNLGTNEILCYTEGDVLVGYLALYHFDEKEVEITLITDPEYRTPALYGFLWEQVKRAVTQYTISIKGYVFSCNQKLTSLRDYLIKIGAESSEFTYKLALTPSGFSKVKIKHELPAIELRQATILDVPALLQLEFDCFQIENKAYKAHLLQTFSDPSNEIYLAVREEKIIGKLHVQVEKKSVFLYDFCTTPQEQKKGYGRALLRATIQHLFDQGIKKIFADVVDEQDMAWYKKENFKCTNTYEHWRLSAYINPIKEREKQLETLILNFQSHQVQDQLSHTFYKH